MRFSYSYNGDSLVIIAVCHYYVSIMQNIVIYALFFAFPNLFDCRYHVQQCHIFVWILWGFFRQQKKPAHRPA